MKSVFFFILTTLLATAGYAQVAKIKGRVTDSLKTCTIRLVSLKDSSIKTIRTGKGNTFTIDAVPYGIYNIEVSCNNVEPFLKTIDADKPAIDLGILSPQKNIRLKEIEVKAKRQGFQQKGDTTAYDPGAYKTHGDAPASNLIDKMPGINMNGNDVMVDGDSVTKLRINGADYMEKDIGLGLKNIPVNAIEKIETYNDKTDQEKLTGVDNVRKTKVINIITRPGAFKAPETNIYAGVGTAGSYAAGIKAISAKGKRNMSLNLGTDNNSDYRYFNLTEASTNFVSPGVGRNNNADLAYANTFKKLDVKLQYTYSNRNSITRTSIYSEEVISEESRRIYNSTSLAKNNNHDHSTAINLKYKFDSSNDISLNSYGRYANTTSDIESGNVISGSLTGLLQTHNNNISTNTRFNTANHLSYNHKFRKPGRTTSVVGNYTYTPSISQSGILSEYQVMDSLPTDIEDNRQLDNEKADYRTGFHIVYTEPLIPNKTSLEFKYRYGYASTANVQYVNEQLDSQGIDVNRSYTNHFNGATHTNSFESYYKIKAKKATASLGIVLQDNRLTGDINDKRFLSLQPYIDYGLQLTPLRKFTAYFSRDVSTPPLQSLSDIVDYLNPQKLITGNPDLKITYRHITRLSYNSTNTQRATKFSTYLSFALNQNDMTDKKIIAFTDTTINDIRLYKGSDYTIPINISGNWNASHDINYDLPLHAIKCNAKLGFTTNLRNIKSYINNQLNQTFTEQFSAKATISSNISEAVDFTVKSYSSITIYNSTLSSNLNTTIFKQLFTVSSTISFTKRFFITNYIYYAFIQNNSSNIPTQVFKWNTGLTYKVYKGLEANILIHDMLNTNKVINNNVAPNYIENTEQNALRRYFMLMLNYKIK